MRPESTPCFLQQLFTGNVGTSRHTVIDFSSPPPLHHYTSLMQTGSRNKKWKTYTAVRRWQRTVMWCRDFGAKIHPTLHGTYDIVDTHVCAATWFLLLVGDLGLLDQTQWSSVLHTRTKKRRRFKIKGRRGKKIDWAENARWWFIPEAPQSGGIPLR